MCAGVFRLRALRTHLRVALTTPSALILAEYKTVQRDLIDLVMSVSGECFSRRVRVRVLARNAEHLLWVPPMTMRKHEVKSGI